MLIQGLGEILCLQVCALEELINIPSKVTVVEGGIFGNCKNLEKIYIHGYVTEIKKNPFYGIKAELSVAPENKWFKVISNSLYSSMSLCSKGLSVSYTFFCSSVII